MESPTPASAMHSKAVPLLRTSQPAPPPLLVGLKAARANVVPGLCLQGLMLAVVFAYYRAEWARPWFDSLGALKRTYGSLFTVVSAVIAGALLPQIFILGYLQRRLPVWRDAGETLFAAFFYAINALCVERFYLWQTMWFGSDATFSVLAKKVAADQFGYNPIFAAPFAVVCFAWKNGGYSLTALSGVFSPQAYLHRVLPTLVATWLVWIPVVAVVYSLPPLLQIPIFSFALCFWALMLAFIYAQPKSVSSSADAFPRNMKPMEPMKPMKPMEPMKGFAENSTDRWWPESLGSSPNFAGGQNEMRYAYFGDKHRLAIDTGSGVSVYDTGEHEISGVQQRQDGAGKKIVFTSQKGEMDLATLHKVGS